MFPRGALRASAFGLDFVAENLGKVADPIQPNLRRGINNFNRWVRTREAIGSIGDINQLSPEQPQRSAHSTARGSPTLQQITMHGQSLGMTAEEIETVLQSWASVVPAPPTRSCAKKRLGIGGR